MTYPNFLLFLAIFSISMACGGGGSITSNAPSPLAEKNLIGNTKVSVDITQFQRLKALGNYSDIASVEVTIFVDGFSKNVTLDKVSDTIYEKEVTGLPLNTELTLQISAKNSQNVIIFNGSSRLLLTSTDLTNTTTTLTPVDDGGAPNSPPVILTLDASSNLVLTNEEIILSATFQDNDDVSSDLIVEWTCSNGSSFKDNNSSSATQTNLPAKESAVTWIAPPIAGEYSITLLVMDADDSTKYTFPILVFSDGTTGAISIGINFAPLIQGFDAEWTESGISITPRIQSDPSKVITFNWVNSTTLESIGSDNSIVISGNNFNYDLELTTRYSDSTSSSQSIYLLSDQIKPNSQTTDDSSGDDHTGSDNAIGSGNTNLPDDNDNSQVIAGGNLYDHLPITKVFPFSGSTFFLCHDGSLWAFGDNSGGKLGLPLNNIYSWINTPDMVFGGNVQSVTSYWTHSLFLMTDGTVYGSGNNIYGQFGDESITQTVEPVQIYSEFATQVGATAHASFILDNLGNLYAAGSNIGGILGNGLANQWDNSSDNLMTFEVIATDVESFDAFNQHIYLVKNDGSLWATGTKSYSSFGNGISSGIGTFAQIISNGVRKVQTSEFITAILLDDDSVKILGQFSNFPTNQTTEFSDFTELLSSGVADISIGDYHLVIRMTDDSVKTFGHNRSGQLGNSTFKSEYVHPVDIDVNVKDIFAGWEVTYYLDQNNDLWGFGGIDPVLRSSSFPLADVLSETTSGNFNFYTVSSNVNAYESKNDTFFYATSDGSIFHGGARDPSLDPDSWERRTDPNSYSFWNPIKDVSVSHNYMLVVDGLGDLHKIGNGGNIDSTNYSDVKSVTTTESDGSSYILKNSGEVYRYSEFDSTINPIAFGVSKIIPAVNDTVFLIKEGGLLEFLGNNHNFNQYGVLPESGYSDITGFFSSNIIDASASYSHMLVLKDDGSVWSAGENQYGQLGDGTFSDNTAFNMVVSSKAKGVLAGMYFSLVIMADSSLLWCGSSHSLGAGPEIANPKHPTFIKLIDGGVTNAFTSSWNLGFAYSTDEGDLVFSFNQFHDAHRYENTPFLINNFEDHFQK